MSFNNTAYYSGSLGQSFGQYKTTFTQLGLSMATFNYLKTGSFGAKEGTWCTICGICGRTFTPRSWARFCPDCRIIRHNEYYHKKKRQNNKH
jgi:hypothetical protein